MGVFFHEQLYSLLLKEKIVFVQLPKLLLSILDVSQ